MSKLPAFQFYPGDWLQDSIAGCSLAAQGLWLRMMFVAHNSDRYGYLMLDGKPLSPEAVARRCGCSLEQYLPLLAELDEASIPSRTKAGVIFSRRMVRDAEKRAENRMYQSTHRKTLKGKENSKTDVRPMSDVSSTSSSSSLNINTKNKQIPSRGKRESTTHTVFKGLIHDAWGEWGNPLDIPWDGAEGKQLGMLIGANPKLGPDGMRRLLQYRARSSGVNLAERPSKWLRSLTDYARGPLNEFKQPQGVTNGNLGNRKADSASTALSRAQARVIAEAESDGGVGAMQLGPGGGDGRDTAGILLAGSR